MNITRRAGLVVSAAILVFLASGIVAQTEQEGPTFSIVSASHRAQGEKCDVAVIVRNLGNQAGVATLTVERLRSKCLKFDENYCGENPAPRGEECTPPCLDYKIDTLGKETAKSHSIGAGREETIHVKVPNEECELVLTVKPSRGLGYGIEIRKR
jgi:hypothetical protein